MMKRVKNKKLEVDDHLRTFQITEMENKLSEKMKQIKQLQLAHETAGNANKVGKRSIAQLTRKK